MLWSNRRADYLSKNDSRDDPPMFSCVGRDPRKVLNGTAVTREPAGTRSEFDLYNDRTETGPAEKLTAFLELESATRANPAVGSAEKTRSQGDRGRVSKSRTKKFKR